MSERLPRSDADAIAEQLRIFAQPQRLMILAELLGGERSVGEIEAATAIGQPALSQQLAELRRTAKAAGIDYVMDLFTPHLRPWP